MELQMPVLKERIQSTIKQTPLHIFSAPQKVDVENYQNEDKLKTNAGTICCLIDINGKPFIFAFDLEPEKALMKLRNQIDIYLTELHSGKITTTSYANTFVGGLKHLVESSDKQMAIYALQ